MITKVITFDNDFDWVIQVRITRNDKHSGMQENIREKWEKIYRRGSEFN
jgi:hypothetical protein